MRAAPAGLGLLLLLGAPLPAAAAAPSPVLVSYSWDDGNVESGPDTFSVFRNARGRVQLSNAFRRSGTQSVEIRDVAGDGAFPELQGYFPERRDGWLIVHFALLVTDPREELNVALAGPQGFRLAKNAISFWLSTRDGYLLHTSDSIPKRLLRLKPFTWYGVDADYDLERGRYDLRIFEEGIEAPVVALRGQPNAASQPGSAVDKFSFIGDYGRDGSNVVYYVDDVVVASTREVALPPFVAPGRRRFLADARPSPTPAEGEGEAARLERQGDDAFRHRDLKAARRLYQTALRTAEDRAALLLKLADVSFLQGDLAGERALREQIFGSLGRRGP
jgi:hypothetical protein